MENVERGAPRTRQTRATAVFQYLGETLWNDFWKFLGSRDACKTASRLHGARRPKMVLRRLKMAPSGCSKKPKKADRKIDSGDAQTVDGRAIVVVDLSLFYNVFRSPEDPKLCFRRRASGASERAKRAKRAERCRRFRLDHVLHIYVLVDL